MSEVQGLERFAEYMRGLEDCYAVIGGAACDLILSSADLDFRATKDIDVILLVEDRFPEVASAVWKLVVDGGYECGRGSSDDVSFYRFTKPSAVGFPIMVELFSKAPSFINETQGLTVVPLHAGDDVSSLSAILLDDDYYAYMKSGRKTIEGVTILDEVHLVPFKAKADARRMGKRSIRATLRNTRRMFSGSASSLPQIRSRLSLSQFGPTWPSFAAWFGRRACL